MKSTVEVVDAVHRKISIEIPWERISQQMERAFKDLAQKVELPGFRRGKAPLDLIRKRFGGEVTENTLSSLMEQTLEEVIMANRIRQVAAPELRRGEFRSGQPFSFQATVEVMPDLELKDIEVQVEETAKAVEESQIDEQLEKIRQSRAVLVPVEDRNAVQAADTIMIDYQAFQNGAPFMQGEGQTVDLESPNTLPGLAERLVGAKLGEKFSFELTMPEGWGPPESQGKPVTFEVTVRAIKRRQLPALDDDFARDVEIEGVDSLAALRQHLRQRLEKAEAERARRVANEQIVKQLIEKNPFPLPPSVLQRRQQYLLRELEAYFGQQGVDLYRHGMNEQKIKEDLRPQAEMEVRKDILLEAVAERLGINPDEKELEQALSDMMQGKNLRPEEVQYVTTSREFRASLYASLRREKALDYLRGRSNMKKSAQPEQSPAGE